MNSKKLIYLDNHATTPMDPLVLKAMEPYFLNEFGNAASKDHAYGQVAHQAVENARAEIARCIGAEPDEIVFTSGATESDNLALKGLAQMYAEKGKHIIASVIEHHAVLDSLKSLEKEGFEITLLPVDQFGQISIDLLKKTIRPETILISIMTANNEIGTVQPIAQIGEVARANGAFFHTDAAQAAGKIPLDVNEMKIDLMSLSAHKFYGPKGMGALYVRSHSPRVRLQAQMEGGGHESGWRSGSLNVPGIVGMAKALSLCTEKMNQESEQVRLLRDQLQDAIQNELDEVYLNGHPKERLPGCLNLSFGYIESEALIKSLGQQLAVSSGAACSSANFEPSYVLPAIGVGPDLAHCAIRFGLGRFTTESDIQSAIEIVVSTVKHLRAESPLYDMALKGGAGAL